MVSFFMLFGGPLKRKTLYFPCPVLSQVVVGQEQEVATRPVSSHLSSSVQCDLCGNTLTDTEAARLHMRSVHNILTYEGGTLLFVF